MVFNLFGPSHRRELYTKHPYVYIDFVYLRDVEAALVAEPRDRLIMEDMNDFLRGGRRERIKSLASRVMHHDFYKWFYVIQSILSLFALITVQSIIFTSLIGEFV